MTRRSASLVVVLLSLLAALPVLLVHLPQMSDYPAHLAAWHVAREAGHNPAIDALYRYEWHWIPNLGTELLVQPLALLFGLEHAGWLIAALVPALLATSLLVLDRVLRGRTSAGGLLALATVWSPALLMGFLNYELSLALAFFGLAGWIALEGRGARTAVFLLAAPLVWLCHLSGWGVLGVLVFGYEWHKRGLVRGAISTWPLWPPALLTLLSGAGTKGATAYGDGLLVDKLSNWVMGLRDQSALVDVGTVALIVVAALVALGRGRIDGRLGRSALLFAVLTFVLPRFLGGGDFADYRLVPVALACAALAIDVAARPVLLALAALPFLLRLGLTAQAWQRNDAATQDMLAVLDHLPRGAKVAGAYGEAPFQWAQPPFSHVFAYATVRRDAQTNADFALQGVHLLSHRQPDPQFADPSQRVLVEQGEAPDLAGFAPAARADYLWYVGGIPPRALPAGAQVVFRNGQTLLLRLAKPGASR